MSRTPVWLHKIHDLMSTCLLCNLVGSNPKNGEWFDEVLYREGDFSVLSAVGPQSEGYVMIVPHAHVHSCAELSPADLAQLQSVKQMVSHVLNQVYGPCIFFEHGASGPGELAGGRIDHAHVHALPTEGPVLSAAKQWLDFEALDGLSALSQWSGIAYVAIENQAGALHIARASSLPDQYVRRIIGSVVGAPDEWDYGTHPNYALIRAAIAQLRPVFASAETSGRDTYQRSPWSDRPLVYLARAVDNQEKQKVAENGEVWRAALAQAGFTPIDPVVTPFPRIVGGQGEEPDAHNFGRIESDLAWLRRCDALVIDLALEDWSYVGCICELVYAHLWRLPTVVMAGSSSIEARPWLRYHATTVVSSLDAAVAALGSVIRAGEIAAR